MPISLLQSRLQRATTLAPISDVEAPWPLAPQGLWSLWDTDCRQAFWILWKVFPEFGEILHSVDWGSSSTWPNLVKLS